jgi:hypothetical protein
MSQAQEVSDLLDFIGRGIFRITVIILCSYIGASLARAEVITSDLRASMGTEDVPPPAPRNQVFQPEYDHDQKKPPSQKLQFEPLSSDLPLLHEQQRKDEEGRGALYPEGSETVIGPASDLTVLEDPIEDRPETDTEQTQEVFKK